MLSQFTLHLERRSLFRSITIIPFLKFGFLWASLDPVKLFLGYDQINKRSLQTHGNWKYRQITLLSIWPPFGTFFCFFGLCGAFWRVGIRFKSIFGPLNVDYQLWFWRYNHIFLFQCGSFLGSLLPFLGPSDYFWVWGLVKKLYLNLPM